jgi:hypothetical protein
MRLNKYFVFAAVFLVALTAFPQLAYAAGPVDLTTSPLPINLTAAPGTTVTTDIRIKNNSGPQTVKVSLMKFGAYGDTGKPILKDRQPGDDYFDWVSFNPGSFLAPTDQWQTVKMTIKVPKDGAFGYYYAVIFTPANGRPTGKGNVLLGSTAVLVLLDVQNPNAKRTLQIVSYTASKHIYEFLPASFEVKFHNSGNVHVQPHGNIFISHGNKQVASLVVNTQEGNILPGTNRIFDVPWADGFPAYANKQKNGSDVLDKSGQNETRLEWDWKHFSKLRFGKYTAHLTAVYDNGKEDVPLDATVSFWVIPWRILFGVLFVLTLVGVGLWASGKNLYRGVRRKK